MPDPLVSVIIPSYNSAPYIARAIESALNQSYRPIEIIVVDDASSDGTARTAGRFASQVRCIVHEANRGPAAARNTAASYASGEFLALLDADDWWFPEKLAIQMPLFAANPNLAVVHTDALILDTANQELRPNPRPGSDFVGRPYDRLFFSNNVKTSSVVLRRRFAAHVGMFDESLVDGYEDYELWIRLSRRYEFAFIPRPLVVYRLHSSNVSRNPLRMLRAHLAMLQKAIAADTAWPQGLARSTLQEKLLSLNLGLGYAYFEAGRQRESRRHFREAIRLGRSTPRLLALWLATWLPGPLATRLRTWKQRLVERTEAGPFRPERLAKARS
jgi:glycosyltransferase involved in cell wall biosynthesis